MRYLADEHKEQVDAGLISDALLFLGPVADLTEMPAEPSIYLDPDFLEAISRRMRLIIGRPLSWTEAFDYASTVPRHIRL
jgi:hypothetical protein